MKDLTLIIPAKNEISCIDFVLKGLEELKENFNILIVVDNNKDNTLEIDLSKYNLNINFLVTDKNGFGNAISEGVAKSITDYVCVFNADGSFDPKSLKKMYSELQNNDFVFCSRYQKHGSSDDDTIITTIGNYIFTMFAKIFFKSKITDILYFYFMTKKNILIDMNLKSTDFCIALEIPLNASTKNYNIKCLPSHERKRYGGKKKVREFIDGFKLLFYMMRFYLNKL